MGRIERQHRAVFTGPRGSYALRASTVQIIKLNQMVIVELRWMGFVRCAGGATRPFDRPHNRAGIDWGLCKEGV